MGAEEFLPDQLTIDRLREAAADCKSCDPGGIAGLFGLASSGLSLKARANCTDPA
jgi:hypothetical protein